MSYIHWYHCFHWCYLPFPSDPFRLQNRGNDPELLINIRNVSTRIKHDFTHEFKLDLIWFGMVVSAVIHFGSVPISLVTWFGIMFISFLLTGSRLRETSWSLGVCRNHSAKELINVVIRHREYIQVHQLQKKIMKLKTWSWEIPFTHNTDCSF